MIDIRLPLSSHAPRPQTKPSFCVAGERRDLPVAFGAGRDRHDVLVRHQRDRRRLRVAAGPGVEQAVLADDLAVQRRRAPSGSSPAGAPASATNSPAFASSSFGEAIVFRRTAAARRSLAAAASTADRRDRASPRAGATASVSRLRADRRAPARRRRPPSSASHLRMVGRSQPAQLNVLPSAASFASSGAGCQNFGVVVRVGGEALHRLHDVEQPQLCRRSSSGRRGCSGKP